MGAPFEGSRRVQPGCPAWYIGQRFARISLKTVHVNGFEHSAKSVAKVRNVSRLGSQLEIDLSILYLTSDPSLTLELAVL
jgi:hypothetical protein